MIQIRSLWENMLRLYATVCRTERMVVNFLLRKDVKLSTVLKVYHLFAVAKLR